MLMDLMTPHWKRLMGLVVLVSISGQTSADDPRYERPPQYVAISFDGSLSIPMWKKTRQVAQSHPVKFTYFISGVYFIDIKDKTKYIEPSHGVGKSAIGWALNKGDISSRVIQMDLALLAGNEIGSHVNAHFPGNSQWNEKQWFSEFSQFKYFVENVFSLNQISSPLASAWPARMSTEIRGFRAPQLETNASSDSILSQYGFVFDASCTSDSTTWPYKNSLGTWQFPLASLVIAGTAKKTLSMDYNFYYAQSKGEEDLEHADLYEEQTFQTYMHYFQQNYSGNRAPLHIGHHFSNWNNGAYNNALYRFIQTVCHLDEVKCVRYNDLVDFLNPLSAAQLRAYQHGQFPKHVSLWTNRAENQTLDLEASFVLLNPDTVQLQLTGEHATTLERQGATVHWFVNKQEKVAAKNHSRLSLYHLPLGQYEIAMKVQLPNGIEILTHTQDVSIVQNDSRSKLRTLQVLGEPKELHNLKGDMIEAHIKGE